MPAEKSGRFLGIPHLKARVKPMKGIAEDTLGALDDDDFDDDMSMVVLSLAKGGHNCSRLRPRLRSPAKTALLMLKSWTLGLTS